MGVTVEDIINYIELLAPLNTAMEWDNPGLLAGWRGNPVERALVALDCVDETLDEAVRFKADLLITHHPLIFHPIKSVTSGDPVGRRLIRLIRAGVSLYCAHTNLDMAEGGVNDALFDALGLREKSALMPAGSPEAGLGRAGLLPAPMSLQGLASFVGQKLGLAHIRYVGPPTQRVCKVGLVGGSGSGPGYFRAALGAGCQAYVTGGIKYHDAQAAREMGLCLIDATHYSSEILVVGQLCDYLRGGFPGTEILPSGFDARTEGNFGYY